MGNIFVADIGGTSSRFALFSIGDDREILFDREIWVETNGYGSFAELLSAIGRSDPCFDVSGYRQIVVAVPGPVTGSEQLSFPNVKWPISRTLINELYPATTFTFINDFIAQAFGCLTPAAADALPIITGEPPLQGLKDLAIIGAGTGTGHGALKVYGDSLVPIPSEAGHAHFPFINKEEAGFRDFLAARTGVPYPVCNDVVSGQGLSRLHQFLTGHELSPGEAARELTPESATTRWFSRFYARACRNFALTALASGGRLFVSGGVAIKNPLLVDNNFFRDEFLDCSSNLNLLAGISVSLIRNERIGLYGAASHAVQTG